MSWALFLLMSHGWPTCVVGPRGCQLPRGLPTKYSDSWASTLSAKVQICLEWGPVHEANSGDPWLSAVWGVDWKQRNVDLGTVGHREHGSVSQNTGWSCLHNCKLWSETPQSNNRGGSGLSTCWSWVWPWLASGHCDTLTTSMALSLVALFCDQELSSFSKGPGLNNSFLYWPLDCGFSTAAWGPWSICDQSWEFSNDFDLLSPIPTEKKTSMTEPDAFMGAELAPWDVVFLHLWKNNLEHPSSTPHKIPWPFDPSICSRGLSFSRKNWSQLPSFWETGKFVLDIMYMPLNVSLLLPQNHYTQEILALHKAEQKPRPISLSLYIYI